MRSVLLLTGVDAGGPVLPGRRWTWEGARLRPWAGMLAKLRAAAANKQRKVVSKAAVARNKASGKGEVNKQPQEAIKQSRR